MTMDLARVWTIIDKEWAEIFKNRLVLFTVGFLPLMLTALPLGILYAMRGAAAAGDVTDLPEQFLAVCGNLPAGQCVQLFILQEFLLIFMIMPLIIPVTIAAYSIVGEKTTRSLEPLLATPITTVELLAAKGLSAVIPAVLATWLGFTVFVAGAPLMAGTTALLAYLLSPVWLLAVFVIGPLLAMLAVSFAVMVSSRATDPRVAEQMAAVIIAPVLATLFGQLAGLITLNLTFMTWAIAALAVVDVGLVYLAARLFRRETILTRWK